jgi:hypothetical protein
MWRFTRQPGTINRGSCQKPADDPFQIFCDLCVVGQHSVTSILSGMAKTSARAQNQYDPCGARCPDLHKVV